MSSIFRNTNDKAVGITVHFPFPMGEETFVRRMGDKAMSLIDQWFIESQHYAGIKYPVSQGLPEETHWILIKNPNIVQCFDDWVYSVEQDLLSIGWEHYVNEGHEIIHNGKDEEVGIYVTMPYPMTYTTFLDRMDDKMHMFGYISKTTRDMPQHQLTECYEMGFFDPINEFY